MGQKSNEAVFVSRSVLCFAFLPFWPASLPAVTTRLAERLLFFVPVRARARVCVYDCAYSPPTHLGSHVIPGNPPSESV